jgi:hypothetical protein
VSKRTKVPRASLACTMLDDPDLIALLQDSSGIQAFAVFCLLLMAAKVQDNGGKFTQSHAVVATMARLPVETFSVGLATLRERTDWIVADAKSITIRSYRKWNSWGGSREGAGRKPSVNQDAIKLQSKPDVPASVSVPVVKALTTKPRKRGVSGESVTIPPNLLRHETIIRRWFDYRAKRKPPIYDVSLEAVFAEMTKFGAALPQSIEQSIANGWQGLFDPKGRAPQNDRQFESRASQGDKFAKLDGRA